METQEIYLRLSQIVGRKAGKRTKAIAGILPISASTWWAGVKAGKFPPAVKLGNRVSVWRQSDVIALVERGAK